jgi:sterol desaturase/sphingolipid hydroxylase (fatty acid hydroxylase superfamily)
MLEGLVAFVIALLLGTFVEYWGHRAMHRWLLRRRHARHHKEGTGQGWLGEFFDYGTGAVPLMLLGFLWSVPFGVGLTLGGVTYAALAAYSHQLQHERPELCFWLRSPVHFLHHDRHMWHHNFGISLDFWDHVFGTYKKVDWQPPARERPARLSDYVRINWLGGSWPWTKRKADGPASSKKVGARAGEPGASTPGAPAECPCPPGPVPGMVSEVPSSSPTP